MLIDGKRILIADHDLGVIKVLGRCLEQAQFSVLAASNGKSALDLIYHTYPHLVILEPMLPD